MRLSWVVTWLMENDFSFSYHAGTDAHDEDSIIIDGHGLEYEILVVDSNEFVVTYYYYGEIKYSHYDTLNELFEFIKGSCPNAYASKKY
jgi:hypothetical protein